MVAELIVGVVAVVFVVVGVVGLVLPLRTLRRLTTTTRRPTDATTGLTAVRGTAETAERTVRAPVSGVDCLGYVVAQQLYYGSTRNLVAFRRTWRREDADSVFVPFDVSDGVERLRVEVTQVERPWRVPNPGGVWSDLRLVQSTQVTHDPDEPVPPALADRFETPIPDDYAARSDESVPHRYVEWRLDTDSEIYLTGRRDHRDAPLCHTVGDELLVDSAATTTRRLAAALLVRWLGAVLVTGLGVAGLLLVV